MEIISVEKFDAPLLVEVFPDTGAMASSTAVPKRLTADKIEVTDSGGFCRLKFYLEKKLVADFPYDSISYFCRWKDSNKK
jgi:hypothetical protein